MHPMVDDEEPAPDGSAHPLERAHRFFQRAAPVIRDATDALERHGGIDGVRDLVVERASHLARQVDEAVADATSIEVEEVDAASAHDDGPAVVADRPATAPRRRRPRIHYVEVGIIVAAATWGALMLQRRRRPASH
jgi:hypothetical protein